jgi:ParB/Sulfiredoxin domain
MPKGASHSDGRNLQIEWRSPDQLVPDTRNSRKHSDRQIHSVARSIEQFGFNVPVLADRTNSIIAGHARVQAAKKLGLRKVPVVRLEHLTDSQARAFAIADNRLAEISTWDDELLAETFKELSALDLDFDIEATGFTVGEIDLRIEGLETAASGSNDEAEPAPEAQTGPAISKLGDLWALGEHRLYCGNALDPAAYQTLMHGRRASVDFADPPYNVEIDGHASGLGRTRHREFAMASGEMNEAEFTSFLTIACTQLARNSINGAILSAPTGGTLAS